MELKKEVIEKLKLLQVVPEKGAWFTKDTIGLADNSGSIGVYYDYKVDVDVPDLTDEGLEDDEKTQEGFAIYDLPNFLSILQLYKDPQITLNEKHLMITDSNGKNKNKYRYCSKGAIKSPKFTKNQILTKVLPPAVSTLELTKDDISRLNKQSSLLSAQHFVFENKELIITDVSNSSFNDFTNSLSPDNDITKIIIPATSFGKIISDDYTVTFHGQAVLLQNKGKDITYVLSGIAS